MPGHDIFAIGASAGGVETLIQLVRGLPSDLPAAVFIVLHIPAHAVSALPSILRRSCALQVDHAKDGMPVEYGHVYIAPPDHHLLIKPGHIHLARGPRENGHRPAVDPLFRTAARAYGPQVIGVVLSGALDDGTAGLAAIKMRGGLAVVQDPADALYDGMPRSAIEHVEIDHILPVSEIPSMLSRLAREPVHDALVRPVDDDLEYETEMAELDGDALRGENRAGTPSGFACPACGGALFEVRDNNLLHFRCRVGHAYASESLLDAQAENLEEALWIALRALEERAALLRRVANRGRESGHQGTADRFKSHSDDAEEKAEVIRRILLNGFVDKAIPNYDDESRSARSKT
jgi:two-component system, chemotaxis family, protein-glutamate methylesterase/glutaminase